MSEPSDENNRRGFFDFLERLVRPTKADRWSLLPMVTVFFPSVILGAGAEITDQAIDKGFDGAFPLAEWWGIHPSIIVLIFLLSLGAALAGFSWLYIGWYHRLDELERLIEFQALATSLIVSVILLLCLASIAMWFPDLDPIIRQIIGIPLLFLWSGLYLVARAIIRRHNDA